MTNTIDSIGESVIHALGLQGLGLVVTLLVISKVCTVVARWIPDDATGWRSAVRKTCRVIGLYVDHRITSGITVQSVAREIANVERPQDTVAEVREVRERIDERIEEAVAPEAPPRTVTPPFPGLVRDGVDPPLGSSEG